MTQSRNKYLAGTFILGFLLALLFIWPGVGFLGEGEEAAVSGTLTKADEDVQVVEVIENEWSLTPNNLTLKPGKVTFILKNEGTTIHDFQVSREGFDKKSKRVRVGRSRIFEITLEPGEYVFFCPIGGHRRIGMEGTLMVQEYTS